MKENNSQSIKISTDAMVFFVKLTHNIKTVRINKSDNILKVKEPGRKEAMDFIVKYFRENNKEYKEMISQNVK